VMPQSSDLARPHESAAPQSTDIGEHVWDASSVPKADLSNCSKAASPFESVKPELGLIEPGVSDLP
jgi:hypothetical protein